MFSDRVDLCCLLTRAKDTLFTTRPIPGNLLVVEVSGPSEAGKLEGAGRGWKGLEGAGRGWEGLEGGGKGWRPQLLSNHTIFPL